MLVPKAKRTPTVLDATTARDTAAEICTKGSSTLRWQSIIIHVLQRTPSAPAGVGHGAAYGAQKQKLAASVEAPIVPMHRPRALARKRVWEWQTWRDRVRDSHKGWGVLYSQMAPLGSGLGLEFWVRVVVRVRVGGGGRMMESITIDEDLKGT